MSDANRIARKEESLSLMNQILKQISCSKVLKWVVHLTWSRSVAQKR